MLHIILGILKVIGILLLAIIGLLLLMILALLFVPVQYRFAGKKLEKVLEGQVSVSWLFRIIGLSAEYSGKQLIVKLKLFGFALKRFGEEKDTKKKKKSGRKSVRKKHFIETETEEFPEESFEEEADAISDENVEEEPDVISDETVEGKTEVVSNERIEAETKNVLDENIEGRSKKASEENDEAETKKVSEGDFDDKQEDIPEALSEKIRKKIGNLLSRLWETLKRIIHIIGRIIEFIFSIPERILALWGKLWDMADAGESAIDRAIKKKDELYKMIKPFLTDNSKALYKRLFGHLSYLWKHCRPRKIQGWMRYGTGAPDVIGQLTGVIYMILPVTAEKFELLPEFTETVFETDVTIKGHIRVCHMIRIAFLLWRDKQLRGLIRRVRAKGGK